MADPHLSPSYRHRALVRANHPAQRFDDQDLASWRRRLIKSLRDVTGLGRIIAQERPPLRVRRLWSMEHELGTIEKIQFCCEPGCDATAFVCSPHGLRGKQPWMVCLQGHTTGAHVSVARDRDDHGKSIEVAGDRDFGLQCLERGIPALCLEQRCFGDRREQAQSRCGGNTCHDGSMQALMLGRTMVAERVYDVDRALDYLWTRKDVDRKRVGVMGNSGGGKVTIFASALLKRIQFAMPSCSFCSFDASSMSVYHCSDNYVPGLLLIAEMGDVLGCLAPKPVVVVAGKEDPLFPIRAVRSEFRLLKRIYAAAGAADRLRLVVGGEGHQFYAEAGWRAARRLFGLIPEMVPVAPFRVPGYGCPIPRLTRLLAYASQRRPTRAAATRP
ncbi:MAG: acetylxylan esterase [Planctomycetota bacterium]|jgi:dienelactone hydrolase|nr:acetylxylan esterase [Planctomycetota bacterium]